MPGSKEIDVAAGSKSAVGRAKPPSAWSEVSRFVAAPMSRLGPNVGAVIGFILIIIVGSLASDVFLSWTNIRNVLLQSAMLGVVSVGMTFVILTGGIDLSVGSVLSFCSVVAAMMFANGQGYPCRSSSWRRWRWARRLARSTAGSSSGAVWPRSSSRWR